MKNSELHATLEKIRVEHISVLVWLGLPRELRLRDEGGKPALEHVAREKAIGRALPVRQIQRASTSRISLQRL